MSLEAMGFPNILFNWIRECVTSTSFLVLIHFHPRISSKERQACDRRSWEPYLFTLVMETKVLRGISREKTDFIVKTTFASLPYLLCGRCAGLRALLEMPDRWRGCFLIFRRTLEAKFSITLGSRNSERRLRKCFQDCLSMPLISSFKDSFYSHPTWVVFQIGNWKAFAGWSWLNRSYLASLYTGLQPSPQFTYL